MTTQEEAMTEYCAAINEHDGTPQGKERIRAAILSMRVHLESGVLPHKMVQLGKKLLK
jgi:hypothetical protein